MCARYTMLGAGQGLELPLPPDAKPRYNIAPSVLVPVVVWEGDKFVARYMIWGMRPEWAKSLLINARAETALEKPTFRNALRERRCLVVASGFFEWQDLGSEKIPYHFICPGRTVFGFAGVWTPSPQHEYPECVIMTTMPNALVAPIHDRMPSILTDEDYQRYLTTDDPREAQAIAMSPYRSESMDSYMVTRKVGNPRFDDPEAVARLA